MPSVAWKNALFHIPELTDLFPAVAREQVYNLCR
jgi:hypothetical protein